jgi:small subunit ribosomal protein S20
MPVTKTAKRALRGSSAKQKINKLIVGRLEIALRQAKKSKSSKDVGSAVSLADRAVKKRVIHKNKAARIKSSLSKLLSSKNSATKKVTSKK